MSRPVAIPPEARVRHALDQYLGECRDNGSRPSVLALAAKFDLSNTTFRRHFPELAKEVAAARSDAERRDTHGKPSPYEILVARNAKLRRANRTLTENLQFAVAQIQRLAVDNARLREALETTTNVTRIDRPGQQRRR